MILAGVTPEVILRDDEAQLTPYREFSLEMGGKLFVSDTSADIDFPLAGDVVGQHRVSAIAIVHQGRHRHVVHVTISMVSCRLDAFIMDHTTSTYLSPFCKSPTPFS